MSRCTGILKKMRVVATALLSAAISFRANPISMYTILGLPEEPESSVTVNLRHGNTHTVTLQQQLVESDGSVSLAGSSWETGFVLADYITNPATGMSWAGKTVVELGSGLGLCSIAAGLMGAASVCATDNSPTALRLLRDNLDAYAASCTGTLDVQPLTWGDESGLAALPPTPMIDIVMASDVVYQHSARDALRRTICSLCPAGSDTLVLLAHRWRAHPEDDAAFFASFAPLGFEPFAEVEAELLPPEYRATVPGMLRRPISIFCTRRVDVAVGESGSSAEADSTRDAALPAVDAALAAVDAALAAVDAALPAVDAALPAVDDLAVTAVDASEGRLGLFSDAAWAALTSSEREAVRRDAKQARQRRKRAVASTMAGSDAQASSSSSSSTTATASSFVATCVIDCSFDELMTDRQSVSLAQQLQLCYASTKRSAKESVSQHARSQHEGTAQDPEAQARAASAPGVSALRLHWSSYGGRVARHVRRMQGSAGWSVKRGAESYLEHYDCSRLVYLSADAEECLDEVDPNAVYVIGGIVDRNRHKGLTRERAEAAGVRCLRLPIAEHVHTDPTHEERRVLAVNHVFEMLMRRAEGAGWSSAIEAAMPKRKLLLRRPEKRRPRLVKVACGTP